MSAERNPTLKRIARKKDYTIGRLFINGKYFCDTIEDKDRGLDQSMSLANILRLKVKGKTAIPTGTYTIVMNVVSAKFDKKPLYHDFCGGRVPRLVNVKGFDGILMHSGYNQNDSAGCPIVGENKVVGAVINSWGTYKRLWNILDAAAQRSETIKITVQ